ncbi:MAG: TIGR03435 family protein [Bryobacteraceae bacterium]
MEIQAKGRVIWKLFAASSLIAMACCAALCQNGAAVPAAAPEFEVATVRPAQAQGFAYSVGMQVDPARVRITNMSMQWYITWAYGLKEFQLSGPAWMASERYDITAKVPAGAKAQQFPHMMQNLLEQRFQLKYHRESRILPVYALVLADSGLKIHPSQTATGPATQSSPGHLQEHGCSLPSLADSLSGSVDRPVVDQTGVSGVFDFTLDWAEDEEHEGAGLPSIRVALLEKLGLKLEPRKLPAEMLIVDHVEKKPSEN